MVYWIWLVATVAAVVAAGLAAIFWALSASVKTPHQSEGPISFGDTATALRKQSKHGSNGAMFAAIAALGQAIATLISVAGWLPPSS